MISQLPTTVKSLRGAWVRAEVCLLAFEPASQLSAREARDRHRRPFVGTVSVDHQQRIALLEAFPGVTDLKLWGNRPQAPARLVAAASC